MYFKELLEKLSGSGDLAVFFLSFSIGFIVDATYFNGKVPSGTIAGVLAIGCLGIKKAVEVSILESNYTLEKLTRKRLEKLRKYFDKNRKAYELLDKLERVLDSKLVDLKTFNMLLDDKLQDFIDKSLNEVDDFEGRYESLYKDFKELHALAELPNQNLEEIKKLWEELDEFYFHVNKSRRRQEQIRRKRELEMSGLMIDDEI